MSTGSVAQAYDRWAPIYDLVFGPVFRPERAAAVAAADRIGGGILEVGVGTGISLPGYAATSKLVGVDLSVSMLDKAPRRVRRCRLRNVEAVEVGDAEALAYPDASLDAVVAQHVISAVPHPTRALDEFARVCRAGGEIIVTTCVSAEQGMRARIERGLMPITSRLGFCTDFPFSLFTDWLATRNDVTLIEAQPIAPLGHFSLVRIAKRQPLKEAA